MLWVTRIFFNLNYVGTICRLLQECATFSYILLTCRFKIRMAITFQVDDRRRKPLTSARTWQISPHATLFRFNAAHAAATCWNLISAHASMLQESMHMHTSIHKYIYTYVSQIYAILVTLTRCTIFFPTLSAAHKAKISQYFAIDASMILCSCKFRKTKATNTFRANSFYAIKRGRNACTSNI